jgi:hypothetical protein
MKYELAHKGTHLYDDVSGWGIAGAEQKTVPDPIPLRVKQWIDNGALVKVEGQEQTDNNPVNPVGGMNVKDALVAIAGMSADELNQILQVETRVTITKQVAELLAKIENAAKIDARMIELQDALEEAKKLEDGPAKDERLQNILDEIAALEGGAQ